MKKTISVLLAALLLLLTLAGCGEPSREENPFTAANEILTYEKIDPTKTPLVVSRTGNIDLSALIEAFEAKNPDIQVIYIDITGGDSDTHPAVEWVKNGKMPDVMFNASGFCTEAEYRAYFTDLSNEPYIASYEEDALARTAISGSIYCLPGPSDITCMTYNKTLFAQYGWEVPATFDEFVSLCKQIREDTDGEIEAWNPNAKYSNELTTAMEAFTYAEVFGGVENRTWYDDFTSGNATFAGHIEPYFEAVKTLADNGILRQEHFSYSATTRGKEFRAGKIAMINGVIAAYGDSEYEFDYMPYPTTKGDIGYLCESISCVACVPKKARTAEVQDAVDRFLTYFSSPAGQEVFIEGSLKVSNVRGVSLRRDTDLSALAPAIEAGNLFSLLGFSSSLGTLSVSLNTNARDMVFDGKTVAACIAAVDAAPYKPWAARTVTTIARAAESFTMLETSFYIADAYRERAGADIALIAHGETYRGNVMCLFAGDISDRFSAVLKPRSFANGAALLKVSMTGAQILAALENPPTYNDGVGEGLYAFSGLTCEVAPWRARGSRFLSVMLSDGTPLERDKLYTVAIWAGTVADAYITEALETYEGTFEALLNEKMTSDGTLTPARDGRIALIWDF